MEETLPLLNKSHRSKKIKQFYQRQYELLEDYRRDDEAIKRGHPSEEQDEATIGRDNLLSKVILVVNVALLFGKGVATYLTNGSSLSIISTLLDSVVDITSGLAIWSATYAIMHTNSFKYPRGRESLEGMSIIFIGTVMGMANFYVIFQSVTVIIANTAAPDINAMSLIIMGVTIATKAVLWVICIKRRTANSLVLAVDQRNDVLTNFVAILGAILSKFVYNRADPIAAIIISGYVTISWIRIILEQIPELVGVKCTDTEYSRVMRVLITHSEKIRCLDTLLVYHSGHKVRVEAHVVLDPEMLSKDVHDKIVDPLQRKLRCLDFVDRAFVHPDYECDGYD